MGHRSVIDFIDCFTELFHITGEDVMGNQAPWDFDVSVKDIYSGLKTGATVQIIPKQYFSIPKNLLDFLVERGYHDRMGCVCYVHYQYPEWFYL